MCRRAALAGDGSGDVTQFFFITPQQDNARAMAGVGQRRLTANTVAGTRDQDNTVLQ